MISRWSAIFLLTITTAAVADTVVMRDGTLRQGTVLSHDKTDLRFQMDSGGITSTLVIPLKQIDRVVMGTKPPTASAVAAVATQPAATLPSAPATKPSTNPGEIVPNASDAELAAFQSRGFVAELLASGVGHGLDDLNRLPKTDRELWDRAVQADGQGKKVETLDALRTLEAAMQELPDGSERLNAIARRERQESFGMWMGKLHWDLVGSKYSTGQFDFKDVREIERPVLIGILKEKTAPALEPLKSYFPPIDEKTGQPAAFRTSQLQGITAANALDVKDKALYAAAVLLAQLRLEPTMPAIDRSLLSGQLSAVNRILSRARDLEPLAKAAIARAQVEQKAAEEKAKREAAIAAQHRPKATP